MSEKLKLIGERFREARQSAGLSEAEAAEKLGVRLYLLEAWEAGTAWPTFHQGMAAAKLYRVRAQWLGAEE